MNGEITGADMTLSGTGVRVPTCGHDTTSGLRSDSLQSAATTTESITVQRFADPASQLITCNNSNDAVAAAALVQMHEATPVGVHTGQSRLATGSHSFPAVSRLQQDTFGPFQSRSYEGAPMFQPPVQYNSLTDYALNVQQEQNAYNLQHSDVDLSNTVLTLSRAMTQMQEQQSGMQSALIDLTAVLQSMKNDTRGDSSTTSATRELNIPPGRTDGSQQNNRVHFSQQPNLGCTDVSDSNRCGSQQAADRTATRGETQTSAETDSTTAPYHTYQHQTRGRQWYGEGQNNSERINRAQQESRYEGSNRYEAIPSTEGDST